MGPLALQRIQGRVEHQGVAVETRGVRRNVGSSLCHHVHQFVDQREGAIPWMSLSRGSCLSVPCYLAVLLVRDLDPTIQRGAEFRALLDGRPERHRHRPVAVRTRTPRVPLVREIVLVNPASRAAHGAEVRRDLLELGCGGHVGPGQKQVFDLGKRDPGDGAHLAVRDRSGGEPGTHLR